MLLSFGWKFPKIVPPNMGDLSTNINGFKFTSTQLSRWSINKWPKILNKVEILEIVTTYTMKKSTGTLSLVAEPKKRAYLLC